jgi:hypothetical protein
MSRIESLSRRSPSRGGVSRCPSVVLGDRPAPTILLSGCCWCGRGKAWRVFGERMGLVAACYMPGASGLPAEAGSPVGHMGGVVGEVSAPAGKAVDRNSLGQYVVRGRRARTINEQVHYLCTGPAHDEPTWLPATERFFYRDRSLRAYGFSYRCRLCANWSRLKGPSRGVSGLVSADSARPFTVELVNRIGMMEASRRTGLAPDVLRRVINTGRRRKVEKLTLRKIMLTLIDVREHGEVRHPASIAHGAAARGKTERHVQGMAERGPRS